MSEIDILMDELLKDVEVNVAAEPRVIPKICKTIDFPSKIILGTFLILILLQEVSQTKPASLGLSIRKDIFMSPKKEVIELGVRNLKETPFEILNFI